MSELKSGYEFLEHTADIRLRVWAADLPQLFESAARGMMDYIFGGQLENHVPQEFNQIELQSSDRDALLVDWLSALLADSSVNYRASLSYDIVLQDGIKLRARVGWAKCRAAEDIKAVTYSRLKIEESDGLYQATITFDI